MTIWQLTHGDLTRGAPRGRRFGMALDLEESARSGLDAGSVTFVVTPDGDCFLLTPFPRAAASALAAPIPGPAPVGRWGELA